MTFQEYVPLAQYSTFHVGGPARYFVKVSSDASLLEALAWATTASLPFLLLGGGSNMLILDAGFPGLVIKIEQRDIHVSGQEVTADAGALTRLVVLAGVRHNLTGMEHLAGIPGTIGGAVRGNAGSFGSEIQEHLTRVDVFHKTAHGWNMETLPREALQFSYRSSIFKRDPSYVMARATFHLPAGHAADGERLVAADLKSRRETQPYELPSIGSVFKNPRPGLFAGKVIEDAGLKGLRVRDAEVSTKHANFIVNRGKATAKDMLTLIATIKERVQEHSGVTLTEEILVV